MALPAALTDLNILSIAAFLLALAYIVWRDRDEIERYSIVFVRRTKRGIEVLDEIAGLGPRIWRIWATIGVAVGFVVMVGGFLLILQQTLRLFLVSGATPPVGPVLPTVSTVTNPQETGYLGLPFWHFMISLTVVMVVHETMHGVIARVEGFDIEYVGLLLIGILPGAFVQPKGQRDFFEPEPEDEGEERSSPWGDGNPLSRLRVLAAGPFANMTLAALLLLVMYGAFTTAHGGPELRGFYDHEGMRIVNVSDGSPAERAGLQPGMRIVGIGDTSTRDLAGFRTATSDLDPGETLAVTTAGNGTFTVTLAEPPERGGNYTFRPAPIDHLLPVLERAAPGTIALYEDHNDLLVAEDRRVRLERWRWIRDRYPSLEARADLAIDRLAPLPEEPREGFMGILVIPDVQVKQGLEPYAGPLFTFFQILFFVALLNLMIGVANLLPVKGLDGGWMLDTAMNELSWDWTGRVTRSATLVTILMIGISFAFLIGGYLV